MAFLTLGSVELEGFESPAGLRFGGAQSLAVHQLIGGGRIIDAMGRDDAELCWFGVLSGQDASGRARLLDAMRVAGQPLVLAWDVFSYDVIISDLALDYRGPWWIEYHIRCTVIADLAQSYGAPEPTLAASLLNDLTVAAGFVDTGAALSTISAPNALVPGVGGLTATASTVAALQNTIGQSMAAQEAALGSSDLATLVSASGSLAQLSCAAAYVGRALTNLEAAEI